MWAHYRLAGLMRDWLCFRGNAFFNLGESHIFPSTFTSSLGIGHVRNTVGGGGVEEGAGLQTCLRARVSNVEPTRPTVFRHVVFAPIPSQDVKAANERRLWRIHPAWVVTESIQGPSNSKLSEISQMSSALVCGDVRRACGRICAIKQLNLPANKGTITMGNIFPSIRHLSFFSGSLTFTVIIHTRPPLTDFK